METNWQIGDVFRDLLGHEWRIIGIVIPGWQFLAEPAAYSGRPCRFGRSEMR